MIEDYRAGLGVDRARLYAANLGARLLIRIGE
jgi:hypothetical protein